jgi:hypothetical protein
MSKRKPDKACPCFGRTHSNTVLYNKERGNHGKEGIKEKNLRRAQGRKEGIKRERRIPRRKERTKEGKKAT